MGFPMILIFGMIGGGVWALEGAKVDLSDLVHCFVQS